MDMKKPAVALIAGPTASGKSALAMALARRSPAVIVNADSAQVYRDLRIVTAAPSAADEAEVPHRLYCYRNGADSGSAADWAEDARRTLQETWDQGRLPVLVGGTGLYLRTLLFGIAPVPPIEPGIREAVRALDPAAARAALEREDPPAAAWLKPGDTARAARALEVIRSTGKPLAIWQQESSGGIGKAVALRPLILLPPRDWLRNRCDQRFEQIFSEEGLEEVRSLLKRRLPETMPVMRAIGVREMAAFLRGELSRSEALERGRIATRQYAKRQYTWFRHQPPMNWPRFESPLEGETVDAALALLASGR
jgi:tRNA dimethylallyltransferase